MRGSAERVGHEGCEGSTDFSEPWDSSIVGGRLCLLIKTGLPSDCCLHHGPGTGCQNKLIGDINEERKKPEDPEPCNLLAPGMI